MQSIQIRLNLPLILTLMMFALAVSPVQAQTDALPSWNDGPAKAGIVGFVERMKRRGFSGSIILEQWPDPPALLVNARDRLIRMFGLDSVVPRQEQGS